ncbi:unnamed protein product [Musa acuminata subsp. malaccensis]|uniref:(wild Malaysian banana) hypothetical protein n=1 Tax=Musa acuminata subsp. malaccensis TaxID=214687 RepID=A0A8D7FID0_MUSAM|nr:unnamed protein product [Musa acuminata subsp. malaccensis]
MTDWPIPKSIKALRGFLGLTGYYRKFVNNYDKISAPLTSLLKKNAFRWLEESTQAFQFLKTAMSTTPVLALPDFNKMFVIESDASGAGIGAENFQNLMLLSLEDKAELKEAGFSLPAGGGTAPSGGSTSGYHVLQAVAPPSQTRITPLPTILKPSAPPTINRVPASKRLTREELRERSVKGLCWHCDEPWSREHRCKKGRLLMIEPEEEEAIEHLEESLEHEEEDMKEQSQPTDITVHALAGYSNPQTMKLQPLPIPHSVWTDISMDFIEGLPSSKGKSTILVVVDRLTKYAHFCAVKNPYTTASIAQIFIENIVKLHGMPRSIVSDRDRIFTSKFWTELFKLQGTKLKMSTAYHPQTDGQTEVVNRCLETYLRCFASDRPKE